MDRATRNVQLVDEPAEKAVMRTAVYTAVFGDYDQLRPGLFPDQADYICFADRDFGAPYPWEVRVINPKRIGPQKASRFFFTQSASVLAGYDYTIMHGGNAILMQPPGELVSLLGDNDIAAFLHPHRSNVYDEPGVCAALGKDLLENMAPQMERYREEGFPGSPFHACILLVRRNTLKLLDFEDLWWREVLEGSYRDQLSFDYARWVTETPISVIPGDPFTSPYLEIHGHLR